MPDFCLDKKPQPGGVYLLHQSFPDRASNVQHLPDTEEERINLGYFDDCQEALAAAKHHYPNHPLDGCVHCCPDCSSELEIGG